MINFKRLELQGFKSFAGKTVIDFKNSFTGIVGPNGCGKSNVADAVRWVLGEMSAKALRGAKMQDVIFNGTEKRPSMSYCEVSLVFDNSNHVFKTDREEVVVTRKLYRSGTSEYYLNHNICRLRDILDVMRDSGAGKDGYSIIGQGKVAEIMDSKPIDRRQIFEEAAGIAKTKAEKIETERKLSRSAEDIQRLTDITAELSRQLVPLAKQREAAQKFFEYKEQMRYQEVNYYLYSREDSVRKKQKIAENVKSFTEELYSKESESLRLAASHDQALEDIDRNEQEVRALMEERERLKVSSEKNSGLMAVFQNKIAHLTEEISRLEEELSSSAASGEVTAETLAEAKNILEIRNKELFLAEQRLDALNDKYFALSEQIAGNESNIERSNSEVFDVFGRLSDVKSSLAGLYAEAGSLRKRLSSLDLAIKSSGATIEREENSAEECRNRIEDANKKKQEIREKRVLRMGEFNEIRQGLYAMNRNLDALNAEYAGKEGRVRAMAEMVGQHDGYQQAVKLLLNDAAKDPSLNEHIEGVVGQLIKVPKEYEVAIEAALGASVQHVVTPTDTDAVYIVNYLKKMEYGVATMIPANKARPQNLAYEYRGVLEMRGAIGICSDLITYDPRHYEVISQLLGRTVLAEDLECARLMADRYDYGVKIVTLDGDIIDPRRTITGGSRRQKTSLHLSKERELADAQKELKDIFMRRETLRAEVEEKNNQAKKIEEEVYALRDDLQDLDMKITAETERIATSEKLIGETNERMTKDQAEYDELNERLTAISKEITAAESLNQDIEGKKASVQGVAQASKTDVENMRKMRDTLSSAVTNAQVELSSLKMEISRVEGDIKRLEEEKSSSDKECAEKRAQLEAVRLEYEKQQANAPALEFTKSEKDRLNQIEKELGVKDMAKAALRASLTEIEKQRSAVTDVINSIMDKRAREESKVEKIDGDLASLRERVLGEYELTEEEMLALRDEENFVPSAAPSAINSLKGKIAQLGSINFNAFEDYDNVVKRHEELSTQLEDLVKAKEDLEKLIAAMNSDMLTKFNAAFENINNNFKKTFSDLFGGGSANLVLVDADPENPSELEKGVDIDVKLPGKAHQNLHSLSGGEQALTSIAILFAILKLRPMPFSILDEIEAALDESNTILLANYLKKYSRDTQFIVITHKKPVMELADELFGVTMEERGVSKVIAVKLSDISRVEA